MGEVQPHDDPGVNALVAVTDVSADPQDVAGEIGRLLRVIMEALSAQAVVLQSADPRAGRLSRRQACHRAAKQLALARAIDALERAQQVVIIAGQLRGLVRPGGTPQVPHQRGEVHDGQLGPAEPQPLAQRGGQEAGAQRRLHGRAHAEIRGQRQRGEHIRQAQPGRRGRRARAHRGAA